MEPIPAAEERLSLKIFYVKERESPSLFNDKEFHQTQKDGFSELQAEEYEYSGGKDSSNCQTDNIQLLSSGEEEFFGINPYKKQCLQNGYDDIDYMVSILDKVGEYEKKMSG